MSLSAIAKVSESQRHWRLLSGIWQKSIPVPANITHTTRPAISDFSSLGLSFTHTPLSNPQFDFAQNSELSSLAYTLQKLQNRVVRRRKVAKKDMHFNFKNPVV